MAKTANSLETILTIDRDNDSAYSVVWSTTHVPGMDIGTGTRSLRRSMGRRRLRVGTLVLGCLLTMHCRVAASALTGGFFVFILLLVPAMALLANPLRHFEVYLGQWSISGPGRAFRIIPMFDGIGFAMCMNAILRAICCAVMAAIAGLYVLSGLADHKLPSLFCRTFDLSTYEPVLKDVETFRNLKSLRPRLLAKQGILSDDEMGITNEKLGSSLYAWKNATHRRLNKIYLKQDVKKLNVCKEVFSQAYPQIYRTPPYNFFYVEVVKLQPDYNFSVTNVELVWSIFIVWSIIWIVMIAERLTKGRLMWNNIFSWFIIIPWLWSILLFFISISAYIIKNKEVKKTLKLSPKDVVAGISDAFEVAMYVHVVSIGTELIHGKGLNYFASGHLDPNLNNENVWHSSLLLLLTVLNAGGAAVCAMVDVRHPTVQAFDTILESTMWVMPLYSKCTSIGNFSHLQTVLIFSGLMFSYTTTAYVFLKTALHVIFEYEVKLVFYEQYLVAALVITCLLLSLIFTSSGGLPLLESIESMMVGIAMPLVCLVELMALLYVYRSPDFVSDMNVANEETTCSTRLGMQWQTLPFIVATLLIMKVVMLSKAEFPSPYMCYATVPLLIVVLAIPIRGGINAYKFLRPSKQRRRRTNIPPTE